MSEQQNRIATLLNSGSSTATTPPTTTASTTTTPDTVSYDIPAGKDATSDQLGIDSTPDALISVDGHQVAAGDNGLSLDIAPDGSTHVTHGPQDPTQLTTSTAGDPYAGTATTVPAGTQTGTTQPGTQPGTTQTGTQPVDTSGTTTSGDTGQTVTPPPDTPIEHLQGIGDHAAKLDLALYGPGTNTPAPVQHQNADGSYDLTIPKGPDNPHAITLHVKPNDDGSLDVTVPKSETNPHEIKIHVQPDKHLDLNITQDKDGHLKIDAHDHPADQQGDWPGLKQPAGTAGDPNNPSDPNNPDVPQVPQMPETPKVPAAGDGSPAGGGGGLPSGGGGMPSGGGGAPSGGGGGLPSTGGKPNVPAQQQPAVPATGYASIRQESITNLGKDIDSGPVQTMDQAHKAAADINIGYPGFGIMGATSGLASAHTSVRNAGAQQFQDGHTALSKWVPNLNATATNWQGAEDDSTTQVNGIPK